MTQLALTHLPNLNNDLERLRAFHTSDTVDVEIAFQDILSEFYRDAIKHARTVHHTDNVILTGPHSLTITGIE